MVKVITAPYEYAGSKTGANKGVLKLREKIKDIYNLPEDSFLDIEDILPESKNKDEIFRTCLEFNEKLCYTISDLKSIKFPLIVLGGDHSVASGTWSGVKSLSDRENGVDGKSNLGLIYIDAHLDIHTPDTSHSKNPHGMPLSGLVGLKDNPMFLIGGEFVKIKPENLIVIGARDYQKEELDMVDDLGITLISSWEIENAFDESFKLVEDMINRVDNFGISFDVDALDVSENPATGLPVDDGLTKNTVKNIFEKISSEKNIMDKFKAFEIVEYFEELDNEKETEKFLLELLAFFIKTL